MQTTIERPPIYGLMAEFHTPEALISAAERAQSAGYTVYDAYAPFPVEGLDEVVPDKGPYLPMLILTGGLIGAVGGFALQYYVSAFYYPMNVGGRPYLSWPQFIPITFELGVLLASLTAVFGMIALNGLPMPYHPVFNHKPFRRASSDRFFLCIEAADPKFDSVATREFLQGMSEEPIGEVPH